MAERATPATLPHAVGTPQRPDGREPPEERRQRDHALLTRYGDSDDPVDLTAVVERFLPLARQLAARYQRPDEPFDDVFQVACFGLVKAIERFDVARGVAFSSYAVPTITGELKRHFRDRTWSVRVPRDLQELALRVERVVGELTRDLGRQPSVPEVARAVGASEEDLSASARCRSRACCARRSSACARSRPRTPTGPGL